MTQAHTVGPRVLSPLVPIHEEDGFVLLSEDKEKAENGTRIARVVRESLAYLPYIPPLIAARLLQAAGPMASVAGYLASAGAVTVLQRRMS